MMSVSNAFDGLMTTEGGDDDDDDFGDFTGAPTTISPQSPPDDDDQAILPTEAASSATSAITPSSLINTATLPNFHPSPLEYAYAAFLLATFFSIPPPRVTLTSNGNSCTNDTKIELLGSSAAPILLTATNVPVPLIHACWNVVDPAGLGVLTHRAQFAVLLRLIALAQAHLVPATSGAFNPTEILLGALERTKQLTVTLPTFAALGSSGADGCGGGSVPSVAKLLELYPPPPPTTQSLSSTSNITSNSSFGAGIEKTNSGEGIRTLSINDAFDSLIMTTTNADLSINENVDNADDEFGEFEGVEEGAANKVGEEVATEGVAVDDDDDDFGNFVIAQPSPPIVNNTLDEYISYDDDDNFGNFETPPSLPAPPNYVNNGFGKFDNGNAPFAGVNGHVQTLSISDAFEGLVVVDDDVTTLDNHHVSLPMNNEIELNGNDNDNDDEFGDFEASEGIVGSTPPDDNDFGDFDEPTNETLMSANDTNYNLNNTLSISKAFHSVNVDEVVKSDHGMPSEKIQINFGDVENEDIENFDTIADDNEFGDFDTATHAEVTLGNVQTLSISDAFEGLIAEETVNDLPLPPLSVAEDVAHDDADDFGDFGDFETPAEIDGFGDFDCPTESSLPADTISSHVKTLSISDAFEELIANDTSTAQFDGSSVNEVDDDDDDNNVDAFEEFNEAEIDQPLQPMNADPDENDDFGDFEAPTHVEEFKGFDGPAQDALGHVKTLSISDAFEGLIHEEVTIDEQLQPMNADNTDEIDDFGDFEAPAETDDFDDIDGLAQDALSTLNVSGHVKTLSISDAFEELIANDTSTAQCGRSIVNVVDDDNIDASKDFNEAEIDVPLQPMNFDNIDEIDDFGDFEAPTEVEEFNGFAGPAQDVLGHVKTLSISDAFEGLIHETAVIDCSLPPLSNVEAGIDDDDFGDFEAPAVDNNELVAEKVLDLPLPSLVIPSTINLSHQRMVSEITTAGGTWKDTAAISDSSAMMPVVSGNQNIVVNNDMIDDDFGDFEGVEGDDSGADGGGIAGAGFTSPEHQVLSINENGDFGGFGVVEESSHVISVNDNEGFGDSAATSQNESTLHVNSHVKTVSVSDAFDELLSEGATSDYPLPPLMPMMIPTAEITSAVDDMNHPDDAAVDALEFRAPLGSGHDSVYSSSYVDEFGDFSGKAGESISGGDDKGDQLVQEVENVDISTKATPVEIVDAGDRKFEEEKKTIFDDGNYHNNQCGEENDNFGEFVDFPSHQENDNIVTATLTDEAPIQNDDGDESFGQFGDFSDSIAHNTIEELTTGHNTSTSAQEFINEEYDLFGDFGDANHDFSDTAKDDGFGQFDALPTLTDDAGGGASDLFVASSTIVQNDDDFGTLDRSDTIHHSNGGYRNEDNSNDDHDNFGDFSSVPNDTPRQISDKEFVLEDILGVEFGRLVGIWKDFVLRAVECDLQNGIETMDDLSNNLSSTDRTCIIKSRKFKDYIFGLAEFVRVVRCISATIGDLLCVDKNIELQETNLSQWKDNSITADAIVIEYLWSQLRSTGAALGMSTPELESVVEIRARGCFTVDSLNNEVSFCQLTLRPLEGGTGTQSRVVWNDKEYMACAANFCANRVPGQAFD